MIQYAGCGSARYAMPGSTVCAQGGSTVYAEPGSTVCAEPGSTVYAEPGSTVYAGSGSMVYAMSGSTVYDLVKRHEKIGMHNEKHKFLVRVYSDGHRKVDICEPVQQFQMRCTTPFRCGEKLAMVLVIVAENYTEAYTKAGEIELRESAEGTDWK